MAQRDPYRFYVYTLARPTGEVFYVGKGSGRRVRQHQHTARRGGIDLRHFVIREIVASGGHVVETIIASDLDEADAFAREKALIVAYAGPHLTNGRTVSPEMLAAWQAEHPPAPPQAMDLSFSTRTRLFRQWLCEVLREPASSPDRR